MKRTISGHRFCFLISLSLALCVQVLGQHTGEGLGGTFSTAAGGTITKTIVDRLSQRDRDQRPQAKRVIGPPRNRTKRPYSFAQQAHNSRRVK